MSLLLLVVMMLAGCAAPDEVLDSDVVMGSGAVPESVPDDFPLPDGAVVGATMIDGSRNRTELNLRLPEEVTVATERFASDLNAVGFVVGGLDEGSATRRSLTAERPPLDVTIELSASSDDTTEVFIRIDADPTG